MNPADEIRRFVPCIFDDDDLGEIRLIPSGRSIFCKASELHTYADELAAANAKGEHVYIGVNPRSHEGRGADAVTKCNALWADFDNCEVGDALDKWEAADLPQPTAVIDSGHGVHFYMRLSEPIDPETWTRWQRDLATHVGSDPSVHDPPRLTRLPGFLNQKDPIAPCRIVQACPSQIIDLADLHGIIPHIDRQPETSGRPEVVPAGNNGAAIADPQALLKGLRYIAKCGPKADGSRNKTAQRAAAYLQRDINLPESAAWMLLQSWDAQNTPPLGDDELRKCLRNGLKYGTHAIGAQLETTKRDDLPTIQINKRQDRTIVKDCARALERSNVPPRLFVRNGEPVRISFDENGRPEIQRLDVDGLAYEVARAANLVKVKADGILESCRTPIEIVRQLLRSESFQLPPVEGVVQGPVLRHDGTILDQPGYDSQTRLYYAKPDDLHIPEIPGEPNREQAAQAAQVIGEILGDFPFVSEADHAAAFGGLLTPVLRQFVDCPTPLLAIDAPAAGTGKTLLCKLIALVATGRDGGLIGVPKDDDEFDKRLVAALSTGATVIVLDNVDVALNHQSLSRILTSREVEARRLGKNDETLRLPNRAAWYANGNNIRIGGDLARRVVWSRVDARCSRPWQRSAGTFRHADIEQYVREHRGELLAALLTMARAWIVAGKPTADVPTLGGFQAWADAVGGTLAFAGVAGFLANLEEIYDTLDDEAVQWEGFLRAIHRCLGSEPTTVKRLTEHLRSDSDFAEALPDGLTNAFGKDGNDARFNRSLGMALRKHAATRFGADEIHILRAEPDVAKGRIQWQVSHGRDGQACISRTAPTRGPIPPKAWKNTSTPFFSYLGVSSPGLGDSGKTQESQCG